MPTIQAIAEGTDQCKGTDQCNRSFSPQTVSILETVLCATLLGNQQFPFLNKADSSPVLCSWRIASAGPQAFEVIRLRSMKIFFRIQPFVLE